MDLKNALHTPFEQYKKIGEFKDAERIQLNDSIIQIENEYYSTIRPKRVCPSGERPINVLKDEGIDYLELRCIDLNPSSPIGITKEQIYFLDLLILFCFFTESPEITNKESKELFKTHKKVVNEGRNLDTKIETQDGQVYLKDQAINIIEGMKRIAVFMDEEVERGGDNSWQNAMNGKKEIVDNPNLSKSGSLLNEIQKKNISHQEYAMELSFLHQKTLNGITNNEDIKFAEVAKNSLSDAIKIDQSSQVDFEIYLADFLSKIS